MIEYIGTRGNSFIIHDEQTNTVVPCLELIVLCVGKVYEPSLDGVRRTPQVQEVRFVVNINSIDDLIRDLREWKISMDENLKKVVTCVWKADSEEDK